MLYARVQPLAKLAGIVATRSVPARISGTAEWYGTVTAAVRVLPCARSGKSTYYRLETFLLEGSQGNDLMDYSKEQVIIDILDQYERHLNFIHLHREAPGSNLTFPEM